MPFIKRRLLLLSVLVLIVALAAGGVFLLQKQKPQAQTLPQPTPSPEPAYPKVNSYQVPILMYHYIRNAEGESELGKSLSVTPENFAAQVQWLKDNNYETLKVSDLVDPQRKILSKIYFAKKKPIILTFDDGYADAYTEALPILKKYQAVATFYLIRDYVGKGNYLSQTQTQELEKAGMEIGSHTLSHPDLTKINLEDAQTQIFQSKENALTFCYPSGKYDSTTVRLVQEAGFQAAVTTHFGIADQNSSILELPRVRVEDGSGETLKNKIEAAHE